MIATIMGLVGRSMLDTDGAPIGKISDFYFDSAQFTLRYFLLGSGAEDRRIIVSPTALAGRDWMADPLPTSLPADKLRSRPALRATDPLDIDEEVRFSGYFGWPYFEDSIAVQNGVVSETGAGTDEVLIERKKVYHNLRIIPGKSAYPVDDVDGRVGDLVDYAVDISSNTVEYLIVAAGECLPGRYLAVAAEWLEDFDWDAKHARITISRDTLAHSPAYDPVRGFTEAYERRLMKYYDTLRIRV
jgi:sporulation protein YlmC with PRC-barrel domain